MDIEYFDKEELTDKILVYTPLFLGVVLFCLLGVFGFFYGHKTLNLASGSFLLLLGGVCFAILKSKYSKTQNVTVNIRDLYFWINNTKYYFNDLLPTFDVSKNGSTKLIYWYNITLYFKNGAQTSLCLPQSTAYSFINKYLSVYSKPTYKQ